MYLHLAVLLSPFATVLLYFVAPAWVAPAVAAVVSALVLFFSAYYMLVADSDLTLARTRLSPSYFVNKRVLITGASSGIGKALAMEIASLKRAARLVIASRNLPVLEQLRTELLAAGAAEVACVQLDIGALAELPAKAAEVLLAFNGLDMLINNAGISTRALAHRTPFEVDEKLMRIDFLGHVALTKALLPALIASGEGHIVNISSIAGKLGAALRSAYCAAKWAVLGHFNAMRAELTFLEINVAVTNVCPGSVATDVAKNAVLSSGKAMGISDGNIASGMAPRRCASLILRGMSAKQHELWISKFPKEKLALALGHYAPELLQKVLLGASGKQRMLGTMAFVERAEAGDASKAM
jgi:short-subunit dehydrogenase